MEEELRILWNDGNFYTIEEYNNKVEEMKEKYINNKKLGLLGELAMLRLSQLAAFLTIPLIMYIIWDKCFTNDILYLCGWWIIVGCPVAIFLSAYIGEAIKIYKNNKLRKIYKSANRKFRNIN